MAAAALPDPHGAVKRKVSYFYDPDIGNYHYGQGHPMKVFAIEIQRRSFELMHPFLLYFNTYSLIEFE